MNNNTLEYYKNYTKAQLLEVIDNIWTQRDVVLAMLIDDVEFSDEYLHEIGLGKGLNSELRWKNSRDALAELARLNQEMKLYE